MSKLRDLDLDSTELQRGFAAEPGPALSIVRVSGHVAAWERVLAHAVRRCYIGDDAIDDRANETGLSRQAIVEAVIPDRGAVMSGDFGEILVFIFQATEQHPTPVIGPKKWRLKQDRRKPAPYSDVVQFIVPDWPKSSAQDVLLCSEVKTKATNGSSTPIPEAIADCATDRIGRLARTLVWLRERAVVQDLGTTTISAP